MDMLTASPDLAEAFHVDHPETQNLPLVVASPHSGDRYPADFLAASRLDSLAIRASEDAYVDEIAAVAPGIGAPLIKALFPRAYVDPNREPYELDPKMFEDPLPPYVNARSPRVAAGFGTVARVVANGAEIYHQPLRAADAMARIEQCYHPYHRALRDLIEATRSRFGYCLLVDCHSMPSIGGPMDSDAGGRRQVDFVLGDAHGAACAPAVMASAEGTLKGMGHEVARNNPYSGGYVTRHYGRPREGVHALQIEINRKLYMVEQTMERLPFLNELGARMANVFASLAALNPGDLGA